MTLNESPSEKEGKSEDMKGDTKSLLKALNESPSEKEGKCPQRPASRSGFQPSMKVPPKRKGNTGRGVVGACDTPNPQ